MDLSLNHSPMTDLFTQPVEPVGGEIRTEMMLRFERDGFVIGVPLLDDRQIEALREAMDDLMNGRAEDPLFYEYHLNESKDDARRLFHALGAWRISAAFHDLIFHRPIVEVAEHLLEGPVRFWHDQVFVKPPHDG